MADADLAARIDRIETLAALEKLINTYHWNADHFDWKAWADCFTEDATFNLPGTFGLMQGRQAIHDTCKGNMDQVYDTMQHVMVNLDFEITGPDSATGHGNLVFTAVPDENRPDQPYRAGGRYTWAFRKTAEGWRIADATLVFLWNTGNDGDAVFADGAAGAG